MDKQQEAQQKEKSQWRNFYAQDRRLEPGYREWLAKMGSRAFSNEEWEQIGPEVHDEIERRVELAQ